MAKRTSSFRSLGIRNLKSSGNSVAKFTVGAASKTAVGLFKAATGDHLDIKGAFSRIPAGIGFLENLWSIFVIFWIHIFGAIVAGVLMFLLIAVAIPLLLGGSF